MKRTFSALAVAALTTACTTAPDYVLTQPPGAQTQQTQPPVDLTPDTALNPARIPSADTPKVLPLPNVADGTVPAAPAVKPKEVKPKPKPVAVRSKPVRVAKPAAAVSKPGCGC